MINNVIVSGNNSFRYRQRRPAVRHAQQPGGSDGRDRRGRHRLRRQNSQVLVSRHDHLGATASEFVFVLLHPVSLGGRLRLK